MRNTRGIVPDVGVLWGFWREAEGGPTGNGLVQLEVNVVRDGPWGGVMANGVGSVGLEDVKYGRGNGQGCLGMRMLSGWKTMQEALSRAEGGLL